MQEEREQNASKVAEKPSKIVLDFWYKGAEEGPAPVVPEGTSIIHVDAEDFDENGNLKRDAEKFRVLRDAQPGVKIEVMGQGRGVPWVIDDGRPAPASVVFSAQKVADILKLVPPRAAKEGEVTLTIPGGIAQDGDSFANHLSRELKAVRLSREPRASGDEHVFRIIGPVPEEISPPREESKSLLQLCILAISHMLGRLQEKEENAMELVEAVGMGREKSMSFLEWLLAMATSYHMEYLSQEAGVQQESKGDLANMPATRAGEAPLSLSAENSVMISPIFVSLLQYLSELTVPTYSSSSQQGAAENAADAQPASPKLQAQPQWARSGKAKERSVTLDEGLSIAGTVVSIASHFLGGGR